ncbi:MAG: hypothetical protein RLZZ515_2705 [Cyanobacteriota bacterium]
MGRAGQDKTGRFPAAERQDKRAEVKRVLLVALGVNVAMTLLKLGIGLLSGSLALLADAMHSATDGLSSLLGLITNNLSDPKPDRDHPYGHDKYEAVGAIAIAGFILFTAFEIVRTAIERISSGLQPLKLDAQELLMLLIVLGCNLLLAGYERSEGKRLSNQLLLADAQHTTSDMAVPGVLNVHDIASRGVIGQRVFIELHMVVDANDLPTAHRITELVEEHLEARFGHVRCTIHLEPREYAIPTITFQGTHG